jgi:uncharacterized membrane protein YhaH (DUF805 family)
VSFGDAVKVCFNKYVDFNGRARRSEFWWWTLFTVILGIVAGIIDAILGTRSASGTGVVGSLVNLAVLLPSLAVGARRLHDTGRSGWWQLLWLVCLVGWIFLIVWLCQDSQGDNKYGSSPKAGMPGPGGAPYGQPGPYGQPPNPYGQPNPPYGEPNPYGQPPPNPYGDPPPNPYGEPPASS